MAASRFGLSHVVTAAIAGVAVGALSTFLVVQGTSDDCPDCDDSTVAVAPDTPNDQELSDGGTTVLSEPPATSSTSSTTSSTTTAVPLPPGLEDYSDIPIGVAVPGGIGRGADILGRPEMQSLVAREFSEVTAENIMKPLYTYPEQDTFSFEATDALVEWAQASGLEVHGHTLLWDAHFNSQVPAWMRDFQGSPDEWREWTDRYVETFVSRYAGRIKSWDVVNEALDDDGSIRDTIWQRGIGDVYIEEAFVAARRADPDAELYYNDFKFPDLPQKLDAAIEMAEDFTARGVPIDGLGFQMHILDDYPDREAISTAFARAAATGLKVKITELDVRVNSAGQSSEFDDSAATRQAQQYQMVIEEYFLAVPEAQRGGITVWGVSDPESYLATNPDWPLLFDAELAPKAAYESVRSSLMNEYGDLPR